MKVLILGNQSDSPQVDEDEYFARFVAFFEGAIKEKDMTVRYTLFRDILFEIGDGQAAIYDTRYDCDLKDYDVVLMRGQFRRRLDFVYVISRYMERYGKLAVNDYSQNRTSSKLIQAYTFFELNVSTPYTLCGSKQALLKAYTKLQLPFICKEVYGAHGHNNYLIKDEAELKKVLDESPGMLFVLQEFVANDGDYRLLIMGSEHRIIKRIASAGTHLNNTSQGGAATLMGSDDLPKEVIEQGRACMEHLGMRIAGLDIIHDKLRNQFVFLEVNSQPQLLTGAFTTEKQLLLGDFLSELRSGLD